MGLLNNVLKEIKELKEKDPDQEVLIPPHMQANKGKKPKILTSQEIL